MELHVFTEPDGQLYATIDGKTYRLVECDKPFRRSVIVLPVVGELLGVPLAVNREIENDNSVCFESWLRFERRIAAGKLVSQLNRGVTGEL